MPRKAKLTTVDGTVIVDDKVVGNRKFTNDQIVHIGTTYDIISIERPDLQDPSGPGPTDVKIRLIVKEAA